MRKNIPAGTALLAAGSALFGVAHAANWTQFGYDGAHTGSNTAETAITAANVAQLAPLYPNAVALPANVDGAPVYAANVSTSAGTKNLLFAFGTSSLTDQMSDLGTLMANWQSVIEEAVLTPSEKQERKTGQRQLI